MEHKTIKKNKMKQKENKKVPIFLWNIDQENTNEITMAPKISDSCFSICWN